MNASPVSKPINVEQAVRQHKAERHARGFSSWTQFVAMLFCQLGPSTLAARDLRRIGELRRQAEASGRVEVAKEIDSGVRERASSVEAVSSGI